MVFGCLIGGSGSISDSVEGFAFGSTSDDLFCALDCEKQINQLQGSFKRDFHLDLLPIFFLCNGL